MLGTNLGVIVPTAYDDPHRVYVPLITERWPGKGNVGCSMGGKAVGSLSKKRGDTL
jgi:hypothetical protein